MNKTYLHPKGTAQSKIVLTILSIFSLVLGLALQAFHPALSEQQTYDSYCNKGDNQCLGREQAFMTIFHRGPATDMEIVKVYHQDPFTGADVQPHPETLPQHIVLDDQ